MAEIGVIQVPRVRWGGKWMEGLKRITVAEEQAGDWEEVADYAGTSAYQVARALNLGVAVPAPPEGYNWEFGSRREKSGRSTLLVRVVAEP